MTGRTLKPILVIGDDMRIFLSVVRALGRAGKTVHAFPFDPGAPALSSHYIACIAATPKYEADPAGWRDALGRLLDTETFDLVIPCGDLAIITLHQGRERFSRQRLAIPAVDGMEIFFDKEETHRMCDDLGIPHVSWTRLAPSDTAENLIARFGLPLVLKPRRSFWDDSGRAHETVDVIERLQHLSQRLVEIPDRSRYLVESYFEGTGTGLSVLSRNGTILQAFQHRRLREGVGGCSSYRVSEAVDARLRQAVERICSRTRHTGVCMFEFRVNHETGRFILIEINARFWGSMPLPLALGLDFPNRLHELLVRDQTYPEQSYPAGIRSRNIMLDANNLVKRLRRDGFTGFGGWLADFAGFFLMPLHWLAGTEVTDSFAAGDMKPAFRELGDLLLWAAGAWTSGAQAKRGTSHDSENGPVIASGVSRGPLG